MAQYRWFNPRLPQTLVISQFLLYFDAAFALLGILSVGLSSNVEFTFLGRLITFGAFAASVYGAWGIANELKRGYQIAVLAAFLPLLSRVVNAWNSPDGILGNVGYVLLGQGILDVIFQYALIALLLHTQSREHQRIWFSNGWAPK